MTPEEIKQFEESQAMLKAMRETMVTEMANQSPYDQNFLVLDTDYDNFMILYTCQDIRDHVNSFGQTQEEVETLRNEDPQKSFDDNFQELRENHVVFASILSRTLNPSKLT